MIQFSSLLLFFLFILSQFSFAQNSQSSEDSRYYLEIDRLLNNLESSQYDSNQVKILNKLSWIYKTSNPSKAIAYAEKALNIADSINYPIGMASSLNYLGVIHNLRGDYQRSLGKFLEDARLYQAIREQVGVAQFYKRSGVKVKDNEDYKKALGYYKASLKLAVGLRDSSRIASPLNNIGKLYKYLEEYDKSLEYFEKALRIYEGKRDTTLIAITINNIAETYEFQDQLALAIQNYKQALALAKVKNNGGQIAVFSNHLANAYQKDGNTFLSEFHALESLKFAQEFRKTQEILTISHLLAQIYAQKGQLGKAYEYEVLHSEMLNTLSKERESQRITQIQELYEAEQNRTRLELLRKDKIIEADSKELQRSYISLVWIILAFISIFTLVLYRSNINR
ncbi:MAG: tetratricopeptide repeat protein, partial [Bacteroidota bacterium]